MINQNQRKREFIQHLLDRYDVGDWSVTYLLEYLIQQPNIINHVKISDQVQYAPHGIVISYDRQAAHAFVYYKNQRAYYLPEQAYHDLRMNDFDPHPFYLEFDVPNFYRTACAYDVYESNPYYDEVQLSQSSDEMNRLELELKLAMMTQRFNDLLDQYQYDEANQLLQAIELIRRKLDD